MILTEQFRKHKEMLKSLYPQKKEDNRLLASRSVIAKVKKENSKKEKKKSK